MAISDSISTQQGGTVSYSGATAITYSKLEYGKLIESTATADEPSYLTFKSNIRSNGAASDYLIRFDRYKNAAAGSPVGAPDALLSAYCVVRCDFGQFTTLDVKQLLNRLGSTLVANGVTGATLDQVLRGEK